jgi:hypothetical protein
VASSPTEITPVYEGDTCEMISLWKRIVSQESYKETI